MRPLHVLGLMSGTSADGVSTAIVRCGPDWIEPVFFAEWSYPRNVRDYILALGRADVRALSRANFVMGEIFGRAAARTLASAGRRGIRVDAIGSHGQTVIHQPQDRPANTLQIGEAAVIAHRAGLTTVSDFRPADMAAGGQGAPLIAYFDHFLFSGRAPIALQNIGGIANVTLVARTLEKTIAFDTGPGNCMIDACAETASGGRLTFDPEGELAAKGRVDLKALERLLSHPFLKRRPPKSACRTDFIPEFLKRAVGAIPPLDALATVTLATARSIASAYPKNVRESVVSGGGVYNRTLMRWLEALLHPIPVRSIADYGWHPQAKEPACFALLALETLRGRPANVPSATGARTAAILGKIAPGPGFGSLLRKVG